MHIFHKTCKNLMCVTYLEKYLLALFPLFSFCLLFCFLLSVIFQLFLMHMSDNGIDGKPAKSIESALNQGA